MTEKTQTPFRVGGVYRDGDGDLFRIARVLDEEQMIASTEAVILSCELMPLGINGGAHYLTTGEWVVRVGQVSPLHLLPGELHQVDGQWVAVDNGGGSGCIGDDYDEGDNWRDPAPETYRAPLTWARPKPFDRFEGFTVTSGREPEPFRDPPPFFHSEADKPALPALQLCADLEPRGYLR